MRDAAEENLAAVTLARGLIQGAPDSPEYQRGVAEMLSLALGLEHEDHAPWLLALLKGS
ncbi:hypothetical protein NUM3379_35130 [Kineococcus sp. NUM-3379]